MDTVVAPGHQLAKLPPRIRGNYGKKFRTIEIVSNHFQVTHKDRRNLFILSIQITPKIEANNIQLREQIIRQIKTDVTLQIPNPIFRGFVIFSREEPKEKQFEVKASSHAVVIQQRKVFDLQNRKVFQLFMNSGLRGTMKRLGFMEIGKSGKYFDTKNDTKVDKLKMFKGFSSNFMQLQRGMYLRVDTARKIVRDQFVLDVINMTYKQHRDKDKQEKRNQVKKALTNSIVMTSYGKCTFYRIIDVVFDKSLSDVRVSEDCPTLKDYYRKKYNIQLKNQSQPLLQVENKVNKRAKLPNDQGGPTYLLPQLCLMTGIPENFDENRRKAISQATILAPKTKQQEIEGFMSLLQSKGEIEQLAEVGIKLSTHLNRMEAKVIPSPTLALGENKTVERGKQAFFNLFNNPLYSCKHDVVCFLLYPKNSDINSLISTIENTSKNLKLTFKFFKSEIQDSRTERGIEKAIDDALRKKKQIQIQNQNQKQKQKELVPNIFLIVLPNQLKTSYPRLKQYTLTGDPQSQILTQFVTEGTLKRKNGAQSVYTKLLLQMAAKRGNILWVPSYQDDVYNKFKGLMLIGMDSASKGGKTIMGCCGTINSTFSLLASSTKQFDGNQTKFKTMVAVSLSCIQSYFNRVKNLPEQIIIFMNSCTGDQVSLYQQHYAQALNKSIYDSFSGARLRLTVVMVNLKNSQRFFDKNGRNVPPGTLVNQEVVSLDFDFFIVSQQSNKGCVVPNHYKVIYNTGTLEEGYLQELIHSQCFNYANWSGSIKIPAILQYAKKCAKFNAQVLACADVGQTFVTRPFFI